MNEKYREKIGAAFERVAPAIIPFGLTAAQRRFRTFIILGAAAVAALFFVAMSAKGSGCGQPPAGSAFYNISSVNAWNTMAQSVVSNYLNVHPAIHEVDVCVVPERRVLVRVQRPSSLNQGANNK